MRQCLFPERVSKQTISIGVDGMTMVLLLFTSMRFSIALSQNSTIWFQSLTFPTKGKNVNASLTSQIASLNGASKAKAPRCWTMAGCQVLDSIMLNPELNINSPIESNANQDMRSLSSTGSEPGFVARSASRPTCSQILGTYSAIALM